MPPKKSARRKARKKPMAERDTPRTGTSTERADWPALPSGVLRLIIERVSTSTRPKNLYSTEAAARACALVCRAFRDSVLAEARTFTAFGLGPGGGGGGGASGAAALTRRALERLPGLRHVAAAGDGPRDDEGREDGLSAEYVREGRAWRQVREVDFVRAPRRLRRLLSAADGAAPLAALKCINAAALPAAAVAELGGLLTRDRLPQLRELRVTMPMEVMAALDWPFPAAEGERGGGAAAAPPPPPPPLPPPIEILSVTSAKGVPPPLGPPSPPAASPEEDAALNLQAAATVTPRLMRALAPTLRRAEIVVAPAPGAAVLVDQGGPLNYMGQRQFVPLEALADLLMVPGLALESLTIWGDIDWMPPDPNAPVPSAPAPGAAAAALAAAQAAGGEPVALNFESLFEANASRFYASGRYEYARRRKAAQFDGVIAALSPSLRSLRLVAPDDGRPLTMVDPVRVLQPGGRLRAWLPECLADLTRLERLAVTDALDALRLRRRDEELPISPASTGRLPPRLRSLALSGGAGGRTRTRLPLDDDAFAGLPELEELAIDIVPRRLSLPRCLLDGRMPGLRELRLSPEAAAVDAALLSTLARRGRVRVRVLKTQGGGRGGEEDDGPDRSVCDDEEEEDDDDKGGEEGDGGGGGGKGGERAWEDWEDWYSTFQHEQGPYGGDGDHWAADYAADSTDGFGSDDSEDDDFF